MRELHLYRVMDEVFWNSGAGEAARTYVQLKFSIMDSGQKKVGEWTTVEFWMRHAKGVGFEARGETVGSVSNHCGLRAQDFQAGLPANSSPPISTCY